MQSLYLDLVRNGVDFGVDENIVSHFFVKNNKNLRSNDNLHNLDGI